MKNKRAIRLPPRPARDVDQVIQRVAHTYGVRVDVSFITNGIPETVVFVRERYEDLMSANPVWAPKKPEGTFRDEDLFAAVDYYADKPAQNSDKI